ncbi:MAG: hypothetical protein JSV80_03575 [Acidobacteriota bacterium]|nr:MAG: hypothetical protein JSV80_03575 [Acidobacteriota bacterium]
MDVEFKAGATRFWRTLAVLFALGSVSQVAIGAGVDDSILWSVHPGRARGLALTELGTDALQNDRTEEGLTLLRQAVVEDPLFAPAWVNMSAACIRTCQVRCARFAALIARLLAPEAPQAVRNLQLAMDLDCPAGEQATDEVASAESRVFERQGDPASWVEAAAARRERGHHLLAVLYEEAAVTRGAELSASGARIVEDLAAVGMWRAAGDWMDAFADQLPEEPWRKRRAASASRLATIRPIAETMGESAARLAGLGGDEEIEGTIRLAEILLARGETAEQAAARLEGLLGVGQPHRFSGAWGEVTADPEWSPVEIPRDPGLPLMALRRFPGDTQIAAYAWPPGVPVSAASDVIVERFAQMGASLAAEWADCGTGRSEHDENAGMAREASACHKTVLEMELGTEGRASIDAYLLGVEAATPTVLLVALAGDAGCGPSCLAEASDALERLLASWMPPVSAPSEAASARSWVLPVPRAWQAQRKHDEHHDPWRTFSLGQGLLIDLPPGIVATAIEPSWRDANASPSTRLWLRGAFEDQRGVKVRVGSERFAGWVDVRTRVPGALGRDEPRSFVPRLDPGAQFRGSTDLGKPLRRVGTAADGVVAHFRGQQFDGAWLISRVVLEDDLVEIGLPVSEGSSSNALLWMALTARREGAAGPPAPVDLSHLYEVSYKRFDTRASRTDPREGILVTSEVEIGVPRGFRVSLNTSSIDGFPITLRAENGGLWQAERWHPAASADLPVRQRQAEASLGGRPPAGWSDPKRIRGGVVSTASYAASGDEQPARCVAVAVPEDAGSRSAFFIVARRGEGVSDSQWKLQCRLARDAIRYRRGR